MTNILCLCHRASVAPRWHLTVCTFEAVCSCVAPCALARVTNHWVHHCSTAPTALPGTDTSRLSPRPVRHSVSQDQRLAAAISGRPAVTVHQHPSASVRDMKAEGFDPLFTNPHTTWYILSPTSLFAALKKSDREASQLAPSVPLSSYRGAAGCAGLKGSHWWAVLYRAKALLSNWRGPAARWFLLDYGCYCARRLFIPLQSVLAPFLFLVSRWASSLLAVLRCIYLLSSGPQLRPFVFVPRRFLLLPCQLSTQPSI